jgi:hypothetical protein
MMGNKRRKPLRRERVLLLHQLRAREGQCWNAKIRLWHLLETRRRYSGRRRSELLDYNGILQLLGPLRNG